jgi:hypothetical protein
VIDLADAKQGGRGDRPRLDVTAYRAGALERVRFLLADRDHTAAGLTRPSR